MDHSARIEFPFFSLELSFIGRWVRGTDLFLHCYQDDGAACAADRESHKST
jgi:hypothetical protein